MDTIIFTDDLSRKPLAWAEFAEFISDHLRSLGFKASVGQGTRRRLGMEDERLVALMGKLARCEAEGGGGAMKLIAPMSGVMQWAQTAAGRGLAHGGGAAEEEGARRSGSAAPARSPRKSNVFIDPEVSAGGAVEQ